MDIQINTTDMEKRLLELREYEVVKSNVLIRKSRHHLSLQEQKIMLYLISKIKPTDENFSMQEFSVMEFCRVCGIDSNSGTNYQNIKDSIKKLADRSIWLLLEDGTQVLARWINKAWIVDKSGVIKICLDNDMKPYLLQLRECFTQYSLLYTLAMRSQYSIRLYELLKSYEYRRKCIFDIKDLKTCLSAENYKRFPDFERNVLAIAIREINELSDLKVECEIIKEGRRYAKAQFSINIKKDMDERLETWEKIGKILNPEKPEVEKTNKAMDRKRRG